VTPVDLQQLELAVTRVVLELGAGESVELQRFEDGSTRRHDGRNVGREDGARDPVARWREPDLAGGALGQDLAVPAIGVVVDAVDVRTGDQLLDDHRHARVDRRLVRRPHLGEGVDDFHLGLEVPDVAVTLARLDEARVHHLLVEGVEVLRTLGNQRLGDGDAALGRQLVREALVDEAFDDVGVRTGHDVVLLEHLLVARQVPDRLVGGGDEHAAAEAVRERHERLDERRPVVLGVGHLDGLARVPR
jgi:hypothetical protein